MRKVTDNFGHLTCPECSGSDVSAPLAFSSLCERCETPLRTFRCYVCKFRRQFCMICDLKDSRRSERTASEAVQVPKTFQTNSTKWIYVISGLALLAACMFYTSRTTDSEEFSNRALIRRLRADYPSQENETWYHLLSVLEKTPPSVKSVTFLHGEDRKTVHCLTNELVSLFNVGSKVKLDDITFSVIGSDANKDYGFSLNRYYTTVKEFRVLITDLTTVSGNIARIFHSLCDEVSFDIKPSLFIFTLKHNEKTQGLKPIERATTILKEAWSNLPQSELSPLLSRIIKNVVEIIPEKQVNC